MKRRSIKPKSVLTGAFALALWAMPLAAHAQAPAALLSSMLHAERTAAYTATQVITVDGHATETIRVWRDGARQRLEWDEPSVRHGDVMVDDGANVWLYHRQENSATQTKSSPRNMSRLALLKPGFTARSLGIQTFGGRRAHGVEVSSQGGKRGARRFWIDDATKIVLRRERIPVGAGERESSELRNVRLGAVPAAKFLYSPPAGTKVTRTSGRLFGQLASAKRLAPWLQIPQSVPRGYSFESAIVDGRKGEAWLRYSTGARRFSIFQQRANNNQTKPPRPINGGLYWQRGGSRFLIVGVAAAAAERIAGSVR